MWATRRPDLGSRIPLIPLPEPAFVTRGIYHRWCVNLGSTKKVSAKPVVRDSSFMGQVRHAFKEIGAFALFILTDAAKAAVIVVALYLFGVLLQWAKLAGVNEDNLYLFERLHFWLNFAAAIILGVWFLVRLVRQLRREFDES